MLQEVMWWNDETMKRWNDETIKRSEQSSQERQAFREKKKRKKEKTYIIQATNQPTNDKQIKKMKQQ
jgi:hypothetical protein